MSSVKLKLTFKSHPRETGLARVTSGGSHVDIKVDRKVVGGIFPPHWSDKGDDYAYKVGLHVKCSEHPGWKIVRFKARFSSEAEARLWVEKNLDSLADQYELHKRDD